MQIYQTDIGKIPEKHLAHSLCVRPDRGGLATIVGGARENAVRVARLDGVGESLQSDFADIFPHSLRFSPFGRLNYVACDERGQRNVFDGAPDEEIWDGISDEGGWTQSGDYVFIGKKGAQVWICGPRKRFLCEENPIPRSLAMSENGENLAWTTATVRGLITGFSVWKNGEKWLDATDILLAPTWNPSGEKLACAFSDEKGAWVQIGEERFGPYSEIGKDSLVWSQNGEKCAWFIRRNHRAHVVINGEETRLDCANVRAGTLGLSPDGSRFAVVAHTGMLGTKGALVVDGCLGPTYMGLGVTPPVWAPASDAVAYFACLNLRKIALVCDNLESAPHDRFMDGSLTWNAFGTRVAAFVQSEKRPAIAVETRGAVSQTIFPENGHPFRGPKPFWSEAETLRDIGFRADGSVFLLEARI